MITLKEFLMGRDEEYPLSIELALNAASLLASINYIRGRYNKPLIISSGYRPGKYNRSIGAINSPHLTCEAIDIYDPDKHFSNWCLDNLNELEKAGLYLENPNYTINWTHLQTRKPGSGNRIFIP